MPQCGNFREGGVQIFWERVESSNCPNYHEVRVGFIAAIRDTEATA